MKIAISATGRDKETKKVKVIENKVRDRPNGVGITAVNTVENEGIDAVITADIGPLAFETFEQSGVKIYKAEGKINDAIRLFEEGKLSEITKATKPTYA